MSIISENAEKGITESGSQAIIGRMYAMNGDSFEKVYKEGQDYS